MYTKNYAVITYPFYYTLFCIRQYIGTYSSGNMTMVWKHKNFWSSKNQAASVPLVVSNQTNSCSALRRSPYWLAVAHQTGLLLAVGPKKDCPTLEKVVKHTRIVCQNVVDVSRSTEHVCNFSPKMLRIFEILNFMYLGLSRNLGCAFYSTILVLWQTIYGGRILLVIALVIATYRSHVHQW